MDIKEFIDESISQIIDSAQDLNNKYGESGAIIAKGKSSVSGKFPDIINVEFDIAVMATESESGSVGAGLKVVSLFEAGAKTNSSAENQTQSRIKFTLPLTLPVK